MSSRAARSRAFWLISGGVAPITTPPATLTFANLAKVSTTTLATNSARTHWSRQECISPDGTRLAIGSTNNTGLMHISVLDAITLVVLDARVIEVPRFFTTDNHNSVALHWTSDGRLYVSVIGHNNAVTATAANQGRVLVFYLPSGSDLDALQGPFLHTMPGTTTTQGANYARWRSFPNGRVQLRTNNDALIAWRTLDFPTGDPKVGIWLRSWAKNRPNGGGENQTYTTDAPLSANVDRFLHQPHPSNVRNLIKALDYDQATGLVTSGATSFGNMHEGAATMVDFLTDADQVMTVADPGAGRSIRLMDQVGAEFCGVEFDNPGGTNPSFVHYKDGTRYIVGTPGPAFDQSRFYFRTICIARETHPGVAYRWYACTTDGSGNDKLVRLECDALGGPVIETVLYTDSAKSILRVFPIERATAAAAIIVQIGTEASFTSFNTGMRILGSTAQPLITFANPTFSVSEGNTGTQTVTNTLNVARNGIVGDLAVNLAYTGTAASGTDYAAPPASVIIPAGQNTVAFDITINGDTAQESNETIVINAALAAYAGATAAKTITINDDDNAAGTLFYEDEFTSASSTSLTSYTSPTNITYTTVGTSTDFNVSSLGRTICGSTAERIVQASVVMPTQDADAEMLVSRPSDVGNAVGIGLRCENGVKGGYYWMLNDGSDLIQILRVSGGTTVVVATCPYTPTTGDLPKPRIRTVGSTAELSILLAGVAQTLAVPATTGITAGTDSKSLIDAAPLTGNRIHLRHNTAITTGNTGCELDRARAYSF